MKNFKSLYIALGTGREYEAYTQAYTKQNPSHKLTGLAVYDNAGRCLPIVTGSKTAFGAYRDSGQGYLLKAEIGAFTRLWFDDAGKLITYATGCKED